MHRFCHAVLQHVAEERGVEQGGVVEILQILFRGSYDVLHLLVQLQQTSGTVIEGHCHERNVERLEILGTKLLIGKLLVHILGDILGYQQIRGIILFVTLPDAVTREILPPGSSLSADITAQSLNGTEVSAVAQLVHFLLEHATVVSMQRAKRLLQVLLLIHELSAQVLILVFPGIILRHHVSAQVQGKVHHARLFGVALHQSAYITLHQPIEQKQHQYQQHYSSGHIEHYRRGIVVAALGVEPFVAEDIQVAVLLKAGILVVESVNKRLVITPHVKLYYRHINSAEAQAFKVQLLDFPFQRLLAPDEIVVLTVEHTRQSLHRGMVLQVQIRIHLLQAPGSHLAVFSQHHHPISGNVSQQLRGFSF